MRYTISRGYDKCCTDLFALHYIFGFQTTGTSFFLTRCFTFLFYDYDF